jgi:hypothetical protein
MSSRGLHHRTQFNEALGDKGQSFSAKRRPFTELRNDIHNTQLDGISLDQIRDHMERARVIDYKTKAMASGMYMGEASFPKRPQRGPSVHDIGPKVAAAENAQMADDIMRFTAKHAREEAKRQAHREHLEVPVNHEERVLSKMGARGAMSGAAAGGVLGGVAGAFAVPDDPTTGAVLGAVSGSSTGAYYGRHAMEALARRVGEL